MKTKAQFVLLIIVIAITGLIGGLLILSCNPDSSKTGAHSDSQSAEPAVGVGQYISGGRNVEAYKYVHTEGHPPIPDKAKFIGTLKGSWYEMGKQLGERSGDYVRYTADVWWKVLCEKYGVEDTIKAMELYEAQIVVYDPNQIEFLKGITEAAAQWLGESPYADTNHEHHVSNYWRVIAASIWDEWLFTGPRDVPNPTNGHNCNSFAVRGDATVDGRMIAAHARQTMYDPLNYEQVFILDPPEGNKVWVLTTAPQVCANQVVNEKGVCLAHMFGGNTKPASLKYSGGPYIAEGFGVPWLNMFLYVAVNADTTEEAIELLTVGHKEYLEKTGRKTLLRGGGWIWLVADENSMAVVEATADRYAVRYPGEFTGPDFTDTNYIVAANHYLCDFSYDQDNNRTDVPMTLFNDPDYQARGSVMRFWTLMWDLKDRYGKIDKYMAQHIMSTSYIRDRKTGKTIWCAEQDGEWLPYGLARGCVQGGLGFIGGGNDSKVSVIDGSNTIVTWTSGPPGHWQGAWDEFHFTKHSEN